MATGVAAALLLAGCGGGGSAASVGPAAESSAAASGSPEPGASAPSAAASPTADARAAVEQAVRSYVEAANVAMATGDTAALRALSTPECTCLRLAESIEELYGSGGRAEGARWDLEELTVVDVTGASASASTRLRSAANTLVRPSGTEDVPASQPSWFITLRLDSGWAVADVDEV